MQSIVAIVIISVFFGACSYVNKRVGLKDDNIFEEGLEKIIEKQIGIDIDLTPDSIES